MAILPHLHSARFSTLVLALGLAASGCSVFHKRAKAPAPVTEAAPAPAPVAPTPVAAARDLADAMTAVLKLPADQTGRIRSVLKGTVEQVNAARQQYPAQSPELAAALKRINITSQTELQKIMGPAKYNEFKTKQAQVQAEMARP